jgi:PPP family 3-phenylpropionic acid transporter
VIDRASSPAWRLAAFYAAFFALVGVQQPFWPVWLSAKGLNATEIGIALALSIGVKLISAPVVAHWADRTGQRRRLMLILAFAACGAFALFALTDGFWSIAAVSVLFFALWPPMMSLAESMTTAAVREGTVHYGRIRLWGSLSFILCAILAGRLLVSLPVNTVFWLSLAAVGLTLLTCTTLPDMRAERRHAARWPLLDVLDDRRFCLLITACGLIQGSHAVYYAFATLHWRAAGYSSAVIGALWAEAVIAEILLFAVGTSAAARIGAAPLLLLAAAAATIRWLSRDRRAVAGES